MTGLILSLFLILPAAAANLLSCRMQGGGAEFHLTLGSTGEFHLGVKTPSAQHHCALKPIEVNSGRVDSRDSLLVAFEHPFDCKPPLPAELSAAINEDPEAVFGRTAVQMYLLARQTALTCKIEKYDAKLAEIQIGGHRKRLPKD